MSGFVKRFRELAPHEAERAKYALRTQLGICGQELLRELEKDLAGEVTTAVKTARKRAAK